MDTRELQVLVHINQYRHFGRAAKSLNLSQPALTKKLQRLEQDFGAKLFERSRAGVVPTRIGLEVLSKAQQIIELTQDLRHSVNTLANDQAQRITIGIGPAMSETAISDSVASYVEKHEYLQVRIHIDHSERLSQMLLEGDLDLFVADISYARTDGRFLTHELPPNDLVWFCRKDHPLLKTRRRKIQREDLLRYPIVSPKMVPWALDWFSKSMDNAPADTHPRRFPAIECESYAVLKRIVLASHCVSAALPTTIAREIKDGVLKTLKVDAPPLMTQAGIVWRRDHNLSGPTTELIELLKKA